MSEQPQEARSAASSGIDPDLFGDVCHERDVLLTENQKLRGELAGFRLSRTDRRSYTEHAVEVALAEAEAALRAKAAGTSNPAYQRHLLKFLRLLDWARS